MKAYYTWLFIPMAALVVVASADAGIIFNRKPKTTPSDRSAELIQALKTDTDERKRAMAAEELGGLDGKNSAITMGLIEALMKDPSSGVRHEAAQALAKLRPISQQAAYALEQAQNNDASTRVRLTARTALWQYTLAGYRNPTSGSTAQTNEPPIAGGTMPAAAPAPSSSGRRQPVRSNTPGVRETNEPPLAPVPMPVPSPGIKIEPSVPMVPVPTASAPIPRPQPPVVTPPVRPLPPPPAPASVKEIKPQPTRPATTPKKEDDGPLLNPPG